MRVGPSVTVQCDSTSISIMSTSYTWIVNNFSSCFQQKGEYLMSPTFGADVTWNLKMYPRGCNSDHIEIHLFLLSCDQLCIHAKCSFSLLDVMEDKKVRWNLKDVVFVPDGLSHCTYLVNRNFLLNGSTRLLPEDRLTILCEIDVANVDVVTNSTDFLFAEMQFNVPEELHLSNHLKTLFDCQKFTDVILSVDDKDFPAHKTILAARSPVFAAMFEHEIKEKIQNRVIITDVSQEVMAEILTFIYTDYSPNLDDLAEDLLAAADKYDLGKLKIMCKKALFWKN